MNHTYFGQWFQSYNPNIHDAIMGPVEAFDPLGYEDAKVGENFVKIGVGEIQKPDTSAYRFSRPYKIVDKGTWTFKIDSDKVTFTHRLSKGRFPYEYTKVLRLEHNKLVIEHWLVNKGDKVINTSVFDHNFFVIDNENIGPGYTVKFPFQILGGDAGLKGFAVIDSNEIKFIRSLGVNDHPSLRTIGGFGSTKTDYDIRIENTKTRAGVRITADRPLSQVIFWSAIKTLCPEPYIEVSVKPLETFKWTITYEFYAI